MSKSGSTRTSGALDSPSIQGLIRWDTVITPIVEKKRNSLFTDKEHVYLICPVCNCVLNKYDRFCRFCGQRIKED